MSRSQYLLLVCLLGFITALPPYSVDLSLAAMPAMAVGLGTSNSMIQFSLSAYFLGSVVGQMVVGPLSDRYGRRPVLFAGLGIYIIVVVGCALATSVDLLIALRLIQGAAVATTRIVPRAMVRDLYDREEAAQMLSFMTIIAGSAPIIAPVVGGHFTVWFGWPSVFVFMAAYAAVALVMVLPFVRETLPTDRRTPLHFARLARNAWQIMCNRPFQAYLACTSCAMGGLYAFLAGSSAVLIRYMGETPEQFGYDFAAVMVVYIVFSFVGGKLVVRLGIDALLGYASALAAVSGLVMVGLAVAGVATVWAVVVPMSGFMGAFALIHPQATAGALSPFPNMAGLASSVQGIIQTLVGVLVSAVVGLLDDGTQMPMAAAVAVVGVGGLMSYRLLVRRLP